MSRSVPSTADRPAPVVIGEFCPLVSQGLLEILRLDPRVSVLASGLEFEALRQTVLRSTPCVAIMSDAVSYSSLLSLRSAEEPLRTLVLVNKPTHLYSTLLLAAGVPHVSANAGASEILAAVHQVTCGETPAISDAASESALIPGLTKRESEVLRYLSDGKQYATIARELHIATETVRTHTRNILTKLGAPNKQALIGRLPGITHTVAG